MFPANTFSSTLLNHRNANNLAGTLETQSALPWQEFPSAVGIRVAPTAQPAVVGVRVGELSNQHFDVARVPGAGCTNCATKLTQLVCSDYDESGNADPPDKDCSDDDGVSDDDASCGANQSRIRSYSPERIRDWFALPGSSSSETPSSSEQSLSGRSAPPDSSSSEMPSSPEQTPCFTK
eukprot:1177419-Prorocentrum_minimum.AAC.3